MIFFGALLNVNLAILNLLPFPVLDGGHIVMATVEWVRRKPTPVKIAGSCSRCICDAAIRFYDLHHAQRYRRSRMV